MLLGAHVSTAGGMPKAIDQAEDLKCEAIQVFTRNQRQWSPPPLSPDSIDEFRRRAAKRGYLKHAVSHASYLINLAATDPVTLDRSRAAFVDEIERCAALGIPYTCLHPGSHLGEGEEAGLAAIAENLRWVLGMTRGKRVTVLLENTAGQGTNLGWRLEHLRDLIVAVKSKRVAVLIDTCHLFAAGYDFRTTKQYDATLGAMDAVIGLERIRAFHLNDSKHECGSKKDRHENIGKGAIGEAAFRRLVREPRFAELPGLLETPGAPEGYRADLATLSRLRGK
ncbi:MAG: deoxyribonuclease IV [Planctomycetes bacterium]|nr:deoxyribonuclease IV [Planctomycetota bacterium]